MYFFLQVKRRLKHTAIGLLGNSCKLDPLSYTGVHIRNPTSGTNIFKSERADLWEFRKKDVAFYSKVLLLDLNECPVPHHPQSQQNTPLVEH